MDQQMDSIEGWWYHCFVDRYGKKVPGMDPVYTIKITYHHRGLVHRCEASPANFL